jgi:hypothetical protein
VDGCRKTIDYLNELKITGKWSSPVARKEEQEILENAVQSVSFYDSMVNGVKSANALAMIKKKS